MTRDEFWTIVKAAKWAEAVAGPEDAVAVCRIRMRLLLGSAEVMKAFRVHFSDCMEVLAQVAERYETHNRVQLPGGDDSFSDLRAMVIGLGTDEYDRTLRAPHLLMERSQNPYGKVTSYVESFAYCIPYENDYDSAELKLEREQAALDYWIGRLVEGDEYAAREVDRRSATVAQLTLEVTGGPLTPEALNRLVRDPEIAALQRKLGSLIEASMELQTQIEDTEAKLDTLLKLRSAS